MSQSRNQKRKQAKKSRPPEHKRIAKLIRDGVLPRYRFDKLDNGRLARKPNGRPSWNRISVFHELTDQLSSESLTESPAQETGSGPEAPVGSVPAAP